MKKFDWDRYVPLGVDGRQMRNHLLAWLGIATTWSVLGFWIRYMDAYRDLFHYRNGIYTKAEAYADLFFSMNGNYVLKEGAVIKPFSEVLGNAFWVFALVAAAMVFVAMQFYGSHFQGSKSIYTMKRLPSPWELRRRCLALPVATAVACGLLTLLL